MKKVLSLILAIVLIVSAVPMGAFTITASAATSGTTGDCTWSLDGTVLTISGEGEIENYTGLTPWGTDITEIVIEDGVTSIGNNAFSHCDLLTSVTISESVTNIGEYAFQFCYSLSNVMLSKNIINIEFMAFFGCDNLTEINVDENNNYYCSVDGILFNKSKTTLVQYPAAKTNTIYTIPNSVIKIDNFGFVHCGNLTNIIIPNRVTVIGEGAFRGCDNLKSITIPDSVISIGDGAFSFCDSLQDVWYMGTEEQKQANLISIGNEYLYDAIWHYNSCIGREIHTYDDTNDTICNVCDAVREIGIITSGTTGDCTWSLDGTVLTISGNGAMADYSNSNSAPWGTDITEVIIEDGVTSIGDYAFQLCDFKTIILPNSIEKIGQKSFVTCIQLEKIIIPDSVISIGEGAFYDCQNLLEVTIGNGITKISKMMFGDCYSLTQIIIPGSVTEICEDAFYRCDALTSITLPSSITSIGFGAFFYCLSLKDVWYGGSENQYQTIDIASVNTYLTNATWHYSETEVEAGWKQDANGWWYLNEDGTYPVSTWANIDGVWYCFNAYGYMVTDWRLIGGSWYYFNASGIMQIGWLNLGGTWYYLNSSGAMITDWAFIDGIWYYFNTSGAMLTGWGNIGGTWYYFSGSGAMLTGWLNLGGTWYYFDGSGAMLTDWQLIDGNWYYFYSSGAMAANCSIDGYWLTVSGAMA